LKVSVGLMPVDRATALRWFRAAAKLGHGYAQLMLGRYLAGGVAGERNRAEARLWLERALAQGMPEAEVDLAELTAPLRTT
jgi:TPR repeat protein